MNTCANCRHWNSGLGAESRAWMVQNNWTAGCAAMQPGTPFRHMLTVTVSGDGMCEDVELDTPHTFTCGFFRRDGEE